MDFAKTNNLELIVDILNKPKLKGESPETFQRKHRYVFLNRFNDHPIIMCHNLNDNMESWVFGSIIGQPKLIPYRNNNVIRPVMLNSSSNILSYLKQHDLKWYEDKTNTDVLIPRNRIRLNVLPEMLLINKGFEKTIKKRILIKYSKEKNNG